MTADGKAPKTDQSLDDFLCAEVRTLLDCMFDGVYIVDPGRRVMFWNRGAEALTGYSSAEVLGKGCRDGVLNHLDENGALLCGGHCPVTDAIRTGRPVEKRIFPRHKSGHRFATLVHVSPIKDSSGRILGAIEVFRDVSADERFRALQQKFDALIQQYVSKATYDSVLEAASRDLEFFHDQSADDRYRALQDKVDMLIVQHAEKGNYGSVLKASSGEAGAKAATRDLTVLFLDVVSFTHLAEQHPAEVIVGFLNQLFSLAAHIIRQHSGDIDKFIGDGVMAVFVSAQDAVDAAREILSSGMPYLNEALAARGFPKVDVRIGICSGAVIQGDIGSDDRKDMTVIGDVVNTASRVQATAAPGGFLISESTFSRLARPAEFAFCTELQIRGKDHRVRLFKPKDG